MFTRFFLSGAILWQVALTGLSQAPQGAPTEEQQSKKRIEELARELADLRAEFEQVKSTYGQRIAEIQEQLDKLQPISASASPSETFRAPAAAAAPAGAPSAVTSSAPQTFSGGERTLQGLNPEISLTGDFTGRLSDNRDADEFNRFNFDGMEMAVQHPLDPYSQAKFFITFEDGEFDLEEGYVSWESLPGKLGLKVGRFHTNFGKLNRYHKHALPWTDRDLPTQTFFGEEGLIGTGVSLSWLPPRLPIAHSNEAYFEVVNNSNDLAFSGRGFGDPVFVGHFLNYYDVTDNAYFEFGLSAATSHWDQARKNRSTVYGLDLSYRWQPLRRALYRSFELRGELFYNDRQDSPGGSPLGLFASGEYQLKRRWFAGLRYQYAESIEDQRQRTSGFSPFLTFWQSEFVRLRAQYDFLERNFEANENRFFLQFTWSMGPHKHEAY
ncbi:MAG TPA: hypothetical protein VLV83_19045 [Acidobacteriota bacterium]|nr:hypothetical protein [Acidobacteriota bacterium]